MNRHYENFSLIAIRRKQICGKSLHTAVLREAGFDSLIAWQGRFSKPIASWNQRPLETRGEFFDRIKREI